MKKKLVFTIGSLTGGGAERVISILANTLCKEYDVTILTIMKDEVAYDLDQRVHYKTLVIPEHRKGIVRSLYRLHLIRKIITEIQPDVVISFLTIVNVLVLAALAFTPYPIIVSERNDPDAETPTKLGRKIRDFFYASRKKIFFVFQTDYARECFQWIRDSHSKIIFNPLKKDLPTPYVGQRKKKIVCVARLEEAKNLSMLLQAFYQFQKKHSDYQLMFFGKGSLEAQLKKQTHELGLSQKVVFYGFAKEVHQLIQDAEMFVLPSNYEGISNAMLEALALGIPTICTDCPAYGARLFIEDGVSGYLIPVGGQEQLLEKMCLLAENDDLRNNFSQKSVQIREKLAEEVIVDEWLQVIERV